MTTSGETANAGVGLSTAAAVVARTVSPMRRTREGARCNDIRSSYHVTSTPGYPQEENLGGGTLCAVSTVSSMTVDAAAPAAFTVDDSWRVPAPVARRAGRAAHEAQRALSAILERVEVPVLLG